MPAGRLAGALSVDRLVAGGHQCSCQLPTRGLVRRVANASRLEQFQSFFQTLIFKRNLAHAQFELFHLGVDRLFFLLLERFMELSPQVPDLQSPGKNFIVSFLQSLFQGLDVLAQRGDLLLRCFS
jgi:hypothetical protein